MRVFGKGGRPRGRRQDRNRQPREMRHEFAACRLLPDFGLHAAPLQPFPTKWGRWPTKSVGWAPKAALRPRRQRSTLRASPATSQQRPARHPSGSAGRGAGSLESSIKQVDMVVHRRFQSGMFRAAWARARPAGADRAGPPPVLAPLLALSDPRASSGARRAPGGDEDRNAAKTSRQRPDAARRRGDGHQSFRGRA